MRTMVFLLLFLLAVVSIAWVATPIFLIFPFRAQSTKEIELAYLLKHWGPLFTAGALLLGIFIYLQLRITLSRRASWVVAVLCLPPLLLATFLARFNHFEMFFEPLQNPSYTVADEVTQLADDDLVIGVKFSSESRAYPVKTLAYHHLLNVTVGDESIVITY